MTLESKPLKSRILVPRLAVVRRILDCELVAVDGLASLAQDRQGVVLAGSTESLPLSFIWGFGYNLFD